MISLRVLIPFPRYVSRHQWMRGNVVMVAVTAVLGTTNASVLSVLGSGVFAVSGTQAPLSRDTEDLISFGGVASVLFEDVPQVCFFFFLYFNILFARMSILSQAPTPPFFPFSPHQP